MIPNYNLFCSAVKDISKKRYSDFLVIHIYLNMFFNLLNFWSAFFVQFFFSQLDSLGSFNRRRATLRILLNKAIIIYLFIYLFIHGLIIIYVKCNTTYPISNLKRKDLISKPWINKIDL